MDIVQLIYRPNEPQGALKDFQFGRSTMEERWQQGLSDARTTLRASPWGCGKRIVPSWSDAVKWPAF
jgi:NTE family protein